MTWKTARLWIGILWASLGLLTVGVILADEAGAHTGTASVDCETTTGDFASFPAGEQTVTAHITIEGDTHATGSSFTGPAGSTSVSTGVPSDLYGEISISAYWTWTADGGGQTDTATFTGTCNQEPPPITVPPPTTTDPPPEPEIPLTPPISVTPAPPVVQATPRTFTG